MPPKRKSPLSDFFKQTGLLIQPYLIPAIRSLDHEGLEILFKALPSLRFPDFTKFKSEDLESLLIEESVNIAGESGSTKTLDVILQTFKSIVPDWKTYIQPEGKWCKLLDNILHKAAIYNEVDNVELLSTKYKVSINTPSEIGGDTPVILAICRKNQKMVKYLIEEKKADLTVVNSSKLNALLLAKLYDNSDAVTLILKASKISKEIKFTAQNGKVYTYLNIHTLSSTKTAPAALQFLDQSLAPMNNAMLDFLIAAHSFDNIPQAELLFKKASISLLKCLEVQESSPPNVIQMLKALHSGYPLLLQKNDPTILKRIITNDEHYEQYKGGLKLYTQAFIKEINSSEKLQLASKAIEFYEKYKIDLEYYRSLIGSAYYNLALAQSVYDAELSLENFIIASNCIPEDSEILYQISCSERSLGIENTRIIPDSFFSQIVNFENVLYGLKKTTPAESMTITITQHFELINDILQLNYDDPFKNLVCHEFRIQQAVYQGDIAKITELYTQLITSKASIIRHTTFMLITAAAISPRSVQDILDIIETTHLSTINSLASDVLHNNLFAAYSTLTCSPNWDKAVLHLKELNKLSAEDINATLKGRICTANTTYIYHLLDNNQFDDAKKYLSYLAEEKQKVVERRIERCELDYIADMLKKSTSIGSVDDTATEATSADVPATEPVYSYKGVILPKNIEVLEMEINDRSIDLNILYPKVFHFYCQYSKMIMQQKLNNTGATTTTNTKWIIDGFEYKYSPLQVNNVRKISNFENHYAAIDPTLSISEDLLHFFQIALAKERIVGRAHGQDGIKIFNNIVELKAQTGDFRLCTSIMYKNSKGQKLILFNALKTHKEISKVINDSRVTVINLDSDATSTHVQTLRDIDRNIDSLKDDYTTYIEKTISLGECDFNLYD